MAQTKQTHVESENLKRKVFLANKHSYLKEIKNSMVQKHLEKKDLKRKVKSFLLFMALNKIFKLYYENCKKKLD